MNNILRFCPLLPPLRTITYIYQRFTVFELGSCKPYGVFYCSFRNGNSFSTHAVDGKVVELGNNCSTPIPSNDQLENLTTITNGDPELEKKLKVLFLEVDIMRQEGEKVPSSLKVDHWKQLIDMATRSMRRKYLSFLWKNEIKKTNEKIKKEERKKIRDERLQNLKLQPDDGHIKYGLTENSIFMRVYDSAMTHFDNCRLIQAMQFSQQLVVDCGFDRHMTPRESLNCAKQLMLLFAENRFHQDPFNLYFCNVNHEGHTMKELNKLIKSLYDDHFPLNISGKSYLDLFPKENLIYLTPHCREEMRTFDHNDVYIIGAIVDKVNQEPLSLAKAKKEGLRMAKLPLDRYLSWGSGSGKSLTLNQMIQILLDLRLTGDWRTSLRHVPKRKIVNPNDSWQFKRKERFGDKLFTKYRTVTRN